MSLVNNIRKICAEKDLTIKDLEIRARISENGIFRWDKHPPGIEKVKRVADVLGVTVDDLLQ